MNYNELQLISDQNELMENEMLEALANDEREYFEYLSQNKYKAIVLDLIIEEVRRNNDQEVIQNIERMLTRVEGANFF